MEENLQKYNSKQHLREWSERINACRNSGMSVREWCKGNGIALSTYYNQQRKVFEAAKTAAEEEHHTKFAEIRLPRQSNAPIATLRIGKVEADIYSGADEETIRTVCRVLKSC